MNLTLVIPPFSHEKSYGGRVFRRGMLPPLGVGYLAAVVTNCGHNVRFIDAPLYGLTIDQTVHAVLETSTDVVGISVLTKMAGSAYALAEKLKVVRPNLPIIFGGPHVTSFYDRVFGDCKAVDYLIPGEGEWSLAELLNALAERKSIENIKGILYRTEDGTVIETGPRDVVQDLDTLPYPLRAIYDHERYIPFPHQARRLPATTVVTSRGCPYGKCRFCYQGGKYASPYRRRSPENVIGEIELLVRDWGIREILFWDDNFCVGSTWINRFCDLLDDRGIDISWSVFGRVNTVDEEMLKRMARSGCYNIYFGFESGSQELLDFVNKGITLEQSRNAVKWAKRAGMEIRGSFILGLPGDTPERIEETIRFACELNADWMIFYPYHIQPGTKLGDIAPEYGQVLEEQEDIHCPSYLPNGFESIDQLSEFLKKAYKRYYLRPRYFLRALWRMRHFYAIKSTILAFLYWLSLVFKKEKAMNPVKDTVENDCS